MKNTKGLIELMLFILWQVWVDKCMPILPVSLISHVHLFLPLLKMRRIEGFYEQAMPMVNALMPSMPYGKDFRVTDLQISVFDC